MDKSVKCSLSQNRGPSMWRLAEVIRHANKAFDLRQPPGKDKRFIRETLFEKQNVQASSVL